MDDELYGVEILVEQHERERREEKAIEQKAFNNAVRKAVAIELKRATGNSNPNHRGANQYPGVCLGCGREVPAMGGLRVRLAHSWRVAHKTCLKSAR